ncbi:MAG TPA: PQQ-binding-like beta-propeller repeat protein [Vicinamibacterales bacterium]
MPWLVLLLVCLAAPHTANAQDWPGFRGPNGQGHSAALNVPLEWSESRNVAWKAAVSGRGWSSPAIASGRVWVTTALTGNRTSLRLLAYDVETGRLAVDVEVFDVGDTTLLKDKNSHASPTPIVQGDRVYVHFGALGTAALTTSGDILWRTQLPYRAEYGHGGSPLLYGELLLVNCDGEDQAYVVALDTRTGAVRWKTPRRMPSGSAYTTPLLVLVGGRDEVVSVGAHSATAYDPTTGTELWRVNHYGSSTVPSPAYGHGMVYLASGFQTVTLLAVRADGEGDVTATHVAWKMGRSAPLTPSPLLVGDELYIVNDAGIATCLDAATGRRHWQQRLEGQYSASPLYADGRIYFLNEDGETTVVAPGTRFRALATNTLDGMTLASPAVSSGSIFIRTASHLYRIATSR